MEHNLKIANEYFEAVNEGLKTFEIRNNDRNFKVEDIVNLEEIDENKEYTGRKVTGKITYITNYAQMSGYVVFSFVKI
jgi:ASC-1-like (ASCH) protein